MKKFILGLCMSLALFGCSSQPSYDRSTDMGTIHTLSLDEVLERMENEETFMFAFTMESCHNCEDFKENILSDYIRDHGFEFNEVVLDNEKDPQSVYDFVAEHPNPADQILEGYSETDVLTPTFYFVKDGEVEDIFVGANLTEKQFDEYIQKYQLDKVEEQE